MTKAEKLDAYFSTESPFKDGLLALRALLLETELDEDWKWNFPTYTLGGKNIAALGSFKEHFGIWFFQGVFLSDTYGVLRNAQEGKTKAMRALNYQDNTEINPEIVSAYIREAIANSIAGKEIKPDRSPKKVVYPDEILQAFDQDTTFKKAFDQLSPGKQREYCEHIGGAKQEATRLRRLQKCIPTILEGKGLNDKYK